MEKVSLAWDYLDEGLSWICLGIISLVRVALSFAFVKIDVRSIVLELLDQKCVGSKGLLEGTLRHQGIWL
jgi:hypothetical protein